MKQKFGEVFDLTNLAEAVPVADDVPFADVERLAEDIDKTIAEEVLSVNLDFTE